MTKFRLDALQPNRVLILRCSIFNIRCSIPVCRQAGSKQLKKTSQPAKHLFRHGRHFALAHHIRLLHSLVDGDNQ
jgi:hypothetical protein